jgi:hypothetical protein
MRIRTLLADGGSAYLCVNVNTHKNTNKNRCGSKVLSKCGFGAVNSISESAYNNSYSTKPLIKSRCGSVTLEPNVGSDNVPEYAVTNMGGYTICPADCDSVYKSKSGNNPWMKKKCGSGDGPIESGSAQNKTGINLLVKKTVCGSATTEFGTGSGFIESGSAHNKTGISPLVKKRYADPQHLSSVPDPELHWHGIAQQSADPQSAYQTADPHVRSKTIKKKKKKANADPV